MLAKLRLPGLVFPSVFLMVMMVLLLSASGVIAGRSDDEKDYPESYTVQGTNEVLDHTINCWGYTTLSYLWGSLYSWGGTQLCDDTMSFLSVLTILEKEIPGPPYWRQIDANEDYCTNCTEAIKISTDSLDTGYYHALTEHARVWPPGHSGPTNGYTQKFKRVP